ncbi:MAG: glycosyltransferase [Bacteroidales bacterium]|nr:glycosyltransferase [Bacteroidales bacterium]
MDNILLIILAIVSAAGAFQLFYWAFFMFRIKRHPERTTKNRAFSVIICAKNEAENLEELIPLLYEQDFLEYEIIVVDDCSTDDTALVLAGLKNRFPSLYYTSIPVDRIFRHGKKLAVTVGIKAAKNEHMVFIDADCRPTSNRWLREIADAYTDGKEMVIGYGKYRKAKGFLNFFIRFETFWNAVQYFGYAVAMRPFMGVGRNMSYTKSLYNDSSKFRKSLCIQSGDDDMFVSEMGTRQNTAVCYTPLSQTISEPKHTWSEWVQQKARHLTTAPYYPTSIKTMLALEVISRQIFIWGSIALLIFGDEQTRIIVGSIFATREIVMHTSLGIAQSRMGEKGLWQYTLIMDILVPWIEAIVWIKSVTTKHRDTWK